jgi:hypothetical protein
MTTIAERVSSLFASKPVQPKPPVQTGVCVTQLCNRFNDKKEKLLELINTGLKMKLRVEKLAEFQAKIKNLKPGEDKKLEQLRQQLNRQIKGQGMKNPNIPITYMSQSKKKQKVGQQQQYIQVGTQQPVYLTVGQQRNQLPLSVQLASAQTQQQKGKRQQRKAQQPAAAKPTQTPGVLGAIGAALGFTQPAQPPKKQQPGVRQPVPGNIAQQIALTQRIKNAQLITNKQAEELIRGFIRDSVCIKLGKDGLYCPSSMATQAVKRSQQQRK